ncbi:hypothetical protein [Herbaspirillum chlorophenolicum]|uniref:hypothetical protein n=1 Tax=Herbaspirillum chlorophenolicum TaxID=211589 RepID=UPI00067E3291|nr:hypothetical protein [Herbaspirillum chlorophenolicum]
MADNFNEVHKAETYKSMITISIEVFKLLVLINGGAAAGMVTAMKSILEVIDHTAFQRSLSMFILGLVGAAVAIFASWITQNILHNENMGAMKPRTHITPLAWAIGASILSLVSFCIGAGVAAFSIHAK